MRESLCNNSVESRMGAIVDTFAVSFSSQDFDPWRIRGSGNICNTGMDEEEDDDAQAVFSIFYVIMLHFLSASG